MGKIRHRILAPEFIRRRVEAVPLTFRDEQTGEPIKERFAIEFKSLTEHGFLEMMNRLQNEQKEAGGVLPFKAAMMAEIITGIFDQDNEPLTDDTGEPAPLTREFFAGLLDEDIEAINAAVRADANPPTRSPAPGRSGSERAASAAS